VNDERIQASDWPRFPVALSLEDTKTQTGAIAFAHPPERLAAVFPALCRSISSKRVATMVALSRLVGIICPGLHSILKNCSLDFTEIEGPEVLRYATLEVIERFRLVRVGVSGPGTAGELAAYGRLPPIAQPTIEEIARLVPKGAYAGVTVLVVGGSRGLGEVAAKACAAGGAHVLVTYAVGRAEAERGAHEISGHGGICGVHAFDVRGDVKGRLSTLPVNPTHLYYFASGPMARRCAKFRSEDVLADFLCFYAKGFIETCNVLLAGAPSRELRAFYPSSIALTNPTRGSTEYAMAKAAGEVLCRNMNQYLPGMHVLCHRLPRLLTDQTATVMPAESSPVLDVMLPIVSEMQSPRKAV
jgi:NADP-dependent 3-hydroxy acid dehydrogenase YdfG